MNKYTIYGLLLCVFFNWVIDTYIDPVSFMELWVFTYIIVFAIPEKIELEKRVLVLEEWRDL
jgi:hypothetical protein